MLNAHLSRIALGAADPTAMQRFYEENLGLSVSGSTQGDVINLGLGAGDPLLELSTGSGMRSFALEVADPDEMAAVVARLQAAGTALSQNDDGSISFRDPDDHQLELHGRIDRCGEGGGDPGRKPVRLHHVTVSTADVPSLAGFYVETLGFAISDRMGDQFMWLRCNREHHTVAIVEGEPGGLDHYCFEIASWDDLKTWCDQLATRGVEIAWGPGRHGPGNNIFIMFDDPAGFHIELSCEMERFWDDRVEYGEPRNWDHRAETINLWGPLPTWRRSLTTTGA